MKRLIDIVNFNADASCLDAHKWLSILEGGANSPFCRWLSLYTRHRKRIVLGMTGATVSDLTVQNPEAVTIVRDNPDIFQVILRPYSHDIPLLRTRDGFLFNVMTGKAAMERAFHRVSAYFLPPEFMLTSEQVGTLGAIGAKATFVNSKRHTPDLADRIPRCPYLVRGVMGATIGCIPVDGEMTQFYLRTIQLWDAKPWNNVVMPTGSATLRLWRDGESPFLLPHGIEREEFWLTHCSADRTHLGGEEYSELADRNLYRSYPPHSFSAWMKEFRMLGYVGRIQEVERQLRKLTAPCRHLWLLAINSDILAAVEKDSPLVALRSAPGHQATQKYRIARSERGYEGEDYLSLLERCLADATYPLTFDTPTAPHLLKAKGRLEHLETLEPTCSDAMRYL
jgi:hypothetical protein